MMRRLPALLLLAACAPPAPDTFNQLEASVVDGGEGASARFVELIDGASDSLHVAIPAGEDTELTDAIARAWDRGVEVEVVTDIDRQDDAGVAALIDAEVPVTLADDGITYFDFNLNADVSWSSTQTVMSHAYAVADRQRIVTANRVGFLEDGAHVVFDLQGEELVEDLLIEHNQVFGGADATSTTAFDGLAKSIADFRWLYHTQSDLDLELWFGPQERLTKRVIDAVYSAKASVWVMTDDFSNEGLARALQQKAEWGFDVNVVVGPSFGNSSPILSRILENETPDVPKRRVTDAGHVPTVVLIDYLEGRDEQKHTSKAFVLTHDLYAAARLHRGAEVVNDQLIDGALWVLDDYDESFAPELLAFDELFWDHFDRGGDL